VLLLRHAHDVTTITNWKKYLVALIGNLVDSISLKMDESEFL